MDIYLEITDYATGQDVSINVLLLQECYVRDNNINPNDKTNPYLVVYKTVAGVLYYEGFVDQANAEARRDYVIGASGGSTPSGNIDITTNGTYSVSQYATASVDVPQPSGTINITTNGTHDVTNYASAKVKVSGGSITLQDKTVVPTTSEQEITADEDYDGLGTVTVEGVLLQDKTVTPTDSAQTITADQEYDALGTVTVEGCNLQSKTVDPPRPRTAASIDVTPDTGYIGLNKVTVNAPSLIDLRIQSNQLSKDQEYYIAPTYGNTMGYQSVTVAPVTSSIDSNIKAANIKSGVTILGVTGTMNSADELYNTGAFIGLSGKFDIRNYIIKIPALFTTGYTDFSSAFEGYTALTDCPTINTSYVTDMSNMFKGCTALKNVPILNTSNVTTMAKMFLNDKKLTDTSLDNILQMCINASSYTGTKTLSTLGITISAYYSQARIQALPHYQDFIDAGWTIS